MKISSLNSINFGKRPLLNCSIKTKSNEKFDGTLYLYDNKDGDDRMEVRESDFLEGFRLDFLRCSGDVSGFNFYVLKNDETNEIISCAKTSRRIKRYPLIEDGTYTKIEDIKENSDYIDPFYPVLGQIIKDGIEHYDRMIELPVCECVRKDMKKYKFSKKEDDAYWRLPERRFQEALTKVELRNQIDYIG